MNLGYITSDFSVHGDRETAKTIFLSTEEMVPSVIPENAIFISTPKVFSFGTTETKLKDAEISMMAKVAMALLDGKVKKNMNVNVESSFFSLKF